MHTRTFTAHAVVHEDRVPCPKQSRQSVHGCGYIHMHMYICISAYAHVQEELARVREKRMMDGLKAACKGCVCLPAVHVFVPGFHAFVPGFHAFVPGFHAFVPGFHVFVPGFDAWRLVPGYFSLVQADQESAGSSFFRIELLCAFSSSHLHLVCSNYRVQVLILGSQPTHRVADFCCTFPRTELWSGAPQQAYFCMFSGKLRSHT